MNPDVIEEVANQVAQISVDVSSLHAEVEQLAHGAASKLIGSPRMKHGRACLGQAAEKLKQALLLLNEYAEFSEREMKNYDQRDIGGTEKIPTRQGWSRE